MPCHRQKAGLIWNTTFPPDDHRAPIAIKAHSRVFTSSERFVVLAAIMAVSSCYLVRTPCSRCVYGRADRSILRHTPCIGCADGRADRSILRHTPCIACADGRADRPRSKHVIFSPCSLREGWARGSGCDEERARGQYVLTMLPFSRTPDTCSDSCRVRTWTCATDRRV